jgi:hypothetical protein
LANRGKGLTAGKGKFFGGNVFLARIAWIGAKWVKFGITSEAAVGLRFGSGADVNWGGGGGLGGGLGSALIGETSQSIVGIFSTIVGLTIGVGETRGVIGKF